VQPGPISRSAWWTRIHSRSPCEELRLEPCPSAETPERLYTIEELVELRRNTLRYARSVPAGEERNKHRQLGVSLRALFRGEKWLQTHTQEGLVSWSGNECRSVGLVRQR
jgi:hypothetical protein